MPRKAVVAEDAPQWTQEELLRAYKSGFGPAIIGEEKWQAAQQFAVKTHAGHLGPAMTERDNPKYWQGAKPMGEA